MRIAPLIAESDGAMFLCAQMQAMIGKAGEKAKTEYGAETYLSSLKPKKTAADNLCRQQLNIFV